MTEQTITIEQYHLFIMTYGATPVLAIMGYLEYMTEYEECAKIISAIEREEKRLSKTLPRRYGLPLIKSDAKEADVTPNEMLSHNIRCLDLIFSDLRKKKKKVPSFPMDKFKSLPLNTFKQSLNTQGK